MRPAQDVVAVESSRTPFSNALTCISARLDQHAHAAEGAGSRAPTSRFSEEEGTPTTIGLARGKAEGQVQRCGARSADSRGWRQTGVALVCGLAVGMVACTGGGSSSNPGTREPEPGPNAELVALIRSMHSNPTNPDPALIEFGELALAHFDQAQDPQPVFYSLIESYMAAIQVPEDLLAARVATLSGEHVFTIAAGAHAGGGAAAADASEPPVAPDTIYFVNGIRTTKASAMATTTLLRTYVLGTYPELADAEFKMFYNISGLDPSSSTHAFCNYFPGGLLPFLMGCAEPDSLSFYLCNSLTSGIIAAYAALRDLCSEGGGNAVDFAQAFLQWLDEMFDSLVPNAAFAVQSEELASLLQADVDAGRRVVVVCHSQGNFFTESALELLLSSVRAAIGVVSVAPPRVFDHPLSYGYFGYHLLEQDAIRCTQTAPEPNRTNPLSEEVALKGCDGCCWGGIAVHDIAGSYLEYPTSRAPIIEDIHLALEALRTGLEFTPLPSLYSGPTGGARLESVVALDHSSEPAVSWSVGSNMLHNVFLSGADTWTPLQMEPVPDVDFMPAVPDPGGGALTLSRSGYTLFRAGEVRSGSIAELGFYSGPSTTLLRGANPTLVLGNVVQPGGFVSAEYLSAGDSWWISTNGTAGVVNTTGLALPHGGLGQFQMVRVHQTRSGYEVRAHILGNDGFELSSTQLTAGPQPLNVFGSASRPDGSALLVVGEQTSTDFDLLAFDYVSGGTWSDRQVIAGPPVGLIPGSQMRVALGDDGAGLLAVGSSAGASCYLHSREAGSESWGQWEWDQAFAPTSVGVSSTGGFLVAARSVFLGLVVSGKRPGSSAPWRQGTAASLGAAHLAGYLTNALLCSAGGGRFLLVADLTVPDSQQPGQFRGEVAAALVRP